MMVSGTAGTGKSYLIHCLYHLLQHQLVVAAPTGVAAFNVNTLHCLLSLPTRGEFKDLEGERLTKLQQSFHKSSTWSLMICLWWGGRLWVKWIDVFARPSLTRLKKYLEAVPAPSFDTLASFVQLPPVMDCPLTPTLKCLIKPTRPSSKLLSLTRSYARLVRNQSR